MMNGVKLRVSDLIGGAALIMEQVKDGLNLAVLRLDIPDDELAAITDALLIRAAHQNKMSPKLMETVREIAQYG